MVNKIGVVLALFLCGCKPQKVEEKPNTQQVGHFIVTRQNDWSSYPTLYVIEDFRTGSEFLVVEFGTGGTMMRIGGVDVTNREPKY